METKTKEQYYQELENMFHWDKIIEECESGEFLYEEDMDEDKIGCSLLGSVFQLAPSGKYYMPWTTNQTEQDIEEDNTFYEALDEILDSMNMFLVPGEGDPCDLFAAKYI